MTDPSTIVFTGPSLRPADLVELRALATKAGYDLAVRPPVRRLDLVEVVNAGGIDRVLILDGEFGQSLAVSITEIRSVLAAGQALAGASSMGALRAVECRTLGMTGSGWVYEQYLSGAIESDGDVALLFDPEDYSPLTVPLANVRWLLNQSELSAEEAQQALRVANDVHFRDRRPSYLLRQWKERLPASVVELLEPELADDRRDFWDRKRLDALDAVRAVFREEN